MIAVASTRPEIAMKPYQNIVLFIYIQNIIYNGTEVIQVEGGALRTYHHADHHHPLSAQQRPSFPQTFPVPQLMVLLPVLLLEVDTLRF